MSKYLIDSVCVALRCGQFVTASEEAGEYILDTANHDLMKIQMMDIAEANGFELNSRDKVADMKAALEIKLYELKLPEVKKMTDTQTIENIVTAGFAAEVPKTDDDMLVEIIESGVKFKDAKKLFDKACEVLGLRKSSSNRRDEVNKILDEAEFSPVDADALQVMVTKIVADVTDTSERQALTAIKRWAKENEVELPKPAKKAKSEGSEKTVAGANGARGQIFGWMIENRGFSPEELSAYILSIRPKFDAKRLENTTKRFAQYATFADLYHAPEAAEEVLETEAA